MIHLCNGRSAEAELRSAVELSAKRHPLRLLLTAALTIGLCTVPLAAQPASTPTTGPISESTKPAPPANAKIPLAAIRGVTLPTSAPTSAAAGCETRAVRDAVESAERMIHPTDTQIEQHAPVQLAAAVQLLTAVLGDPIQDCYDVRYLLAQAHAALGDSQAAVNNAMRAADMRPEAPDVRFLLGTLYEADGRGEAAIEQYRTVTLRGDRELNNPRVTAAWFRLGRCLERAGYWTAAESALARFDEIVLEDAPEHLHDPTVAALMHDRPFGALDTRLSLLRQLGDFKRALQVIREAIERKGSDAYLARLLIRAQIEAGEPAAALETMRQGNQDDDKSLLDGPLTLALVAMRQSGALNDWLAKLERDVAHGERLAFAAAVADRLESSDGAVDALRLRRALAAAQPKDAEAQWRLAAALKRSGNLRAAIDTLIGLVRAADCANSADVDAAKTGGWLLPGAALSEWMASFRTADEFLTMVQDYGNAGTRDFAADFVYGITAAAAGQDELASQLFQSCLAARPTCAAAHVAWGRAMLAHFAWADAKAAAEKALKIDENFAPAQALLAEALSGLDENDDADVAYRRAAQLAPHDIAVRLAMARSYERLGRMGATAAQRRFAEVLQLDPSHAEAAEALIRSYIATDKLDLARQRMAAVEAGDFREPVVQRLRIALRRAAGASDEDFCNDLQRHVAQYPDDVRANLDLAAVLFHMDRVGEASTIVERLRSLAPDDDAVVSLLIDLHFARIEADKAVALLQSRVDRYPNRRSLLQALASACLQDFQLERGRSVLKRVLALRMDDREREVVRQMMLQTYLVFDDAADGLPLVDELLTAQPGDPRLGALRLQLLVRAGRNGDAMKAASQYLDADPTDDAIRSAYCDVARLTRSQRVAIPRVKEWIGEGEFSPWTITLVDLMLEDGQGSEAIAFVKAQSSNDVATALRRRLTLADCQRRAGKLPESIAEYEALLKDRTLMSFRDTVNEGRRGLVYALQDAGRAADALARIDEWLVADQKDTNRPIFPGEIDPTSPDEQAYWLTLRADMLRALDRDDEALEARRQARTMAPHERGMDNDVGYYLADLGRDVESATTMIARAVASEPLNAAFLDSYGWAFYKAGNFAMAQKFLSRSLRLWSGREGITVIDHLGDAEYRLGNKPAAQELWRKAQKIGETAYPWRISTDDRRALAAIRRKLGALEGQNEPPLAQTAAEQHAKD